jgi:hypothetical protein
VPIKITAPALLRVIAVRSAAVSPVTLTPTMINWPACSLTLSAADSVAHKGGEAGTGVAGAWLTEAVAVGVRGGASHPATRMDRADSAAARRP